MEGPGQGWGLCQGAGPEGISARTARLSHSRGSWGCSTQAKSGTRTTQSAPAPTARTPTVPRKESSWCRFRGGGGGTVNYLEKSSPTPDREPAPCPGKSYPGLWSRNCFQEQTDRGRRITFCKPGAESEESDKAPKWQEEKNYSRSKAHNRESEEGVAGRIAVTNFSTVFRSIRVASRGSARREAGGRRGGGASRAERPPRQVQSRGPAAASRSGSAW